MKISCRSSKRATSCELAKKTGFHCVRTSIKQQISYIHWLQIVNRERSNFVLFLNRTAVLMDESKSVAQPTPGTSSGTDSATIPPVLTEPVNKLVHSQ